MANTPVRWIGGYNADKWRRAGRKVAEGPGSLFIRPRAFFTLLSDRRLNSVNLYLIDRLYATSKERYTRGMGGEVLGWGPVHDQIVQQDDWISFG